MKVVIEFYRTRRKDDAHAVVGRETVEAADLENALGIAREMSRTLNMPQLPDAVTITGADGAILHSGSIPGHEGRPANEH